MVARSLARDRDHARALVMAGSVIVDDHRIDKPRTPVSTESEIRLRGAAAPYAGRGGEKLEVPLREFSVPVADAAVLDVGASTGGFTDCLLQHGAARVYAVDVGYGQLAWKLQQDPRVIRLDRTHVRNLTPEQLQPRPDLAVIDASFISLKNILRHVAGLIRPGGSILALVKPQFEVHRKQIAAGGIVRDAELYRDVIAGLIETAHSLPMLVSGIMESPLQGRKGNREFFLYLT